MLFIYKILHCNCFLFTALEASALHVSKVHAKIQIQEVQEIFEKINLLL